ncbi:MAG: hypothetical protein ABI435_09745 [Pseudolysinimonas sp.]
MSAVAISGLSIAAEPRAQLLPASVKDREKSRNARHMMVLLVILAVAVAGAGVTWGYVGKIAAQQTLDAANAQTTAILAEQTQYADASRLAALVKQTADAQVAVTATEVQWLPLYAAILGYLPADAQVVGLAFTAPAPWEPILSADGPLRVAPFATVRLDVSSLSYLEAATFVRNIPSLYGYADVKIDSTKLDPESGEYVTSITLTLSADAVSGRFGATQNGTAANGTAGGGATGDGTTGTGTTTDGTTTNGTTTNGTTTNDGTNP